MKIFGFNITNASKKAPERTRSGKMVHEQQLMRSNQDIASWRSAVQFAESILAPNRLNLYRTYKDIVLDGHLSGVIETRKNKIRSRKYKVVDVKGDEVEEKTKLLNAQWFYDFTEYALDSIYYGFSLIQFGDLVNDKFTEIELIPRQYVKPELNIVIHDTGLYSGTDFTQKPWADWLVPVGNKKDLGLLMKVAPLVIWKKNAIGAWSEAAELFGMPIRVGKTNVRDDAMRSNMQNMLKNMGTAAWGVFDTDDTLELISTGKADVYQVYDKLIERCNNEISKIILGHGSAIDSTPGKLGSEEQVNDGGQDYCLSDSRLMQFVYNDLLFPFLSNKRMGFDGLSFEYDDSEDLTIDEQFVIDGKLLDYYDIPEDYILSKYGTPVIKKVEPVQPGGADGSNFQNYFK